MELENIFAFNLRRLRELRGDSRSRVIQYLEKRGIKMHMTTLKRIEDGEQQPKLSEAVAFAEIFGVTVDDLVQVPFVVDEEWILIEAAKVEEARKRVIHNWEVWHNVSLDFIQRTALHTMKKQQVENNTDTWVLDEDTNYAMELFSEKLLLDELERLGFLKGLLIKESPVKNNG